MEVRIQRNGTSRIYSCLKKLQEVPGQAGQDLPAFGIGGFRWCIPCSEALACMVTKQVYVICRITRWACSSVPTHMAIDKACGISRINRLALSKSVRIQSIAGAAPRQIRICTRVISKVYKVVGFRQRHWSNVLTYRIRVFRDGLHHIGAVFWQIGGGTGQQ